MTSRTQDALGRLQPHTVPGPAAYMVHVATETARRRCALSQPAQLEAPQFFQVVLDQAPLADSLVTGLVRARNSPCPDLQREEPTVARTYGEQLACVGEFYALTETPAIAHFAAVHHHLEQVLAVVSRADRRDWILRNIVRLRKDLDLLETAVVTRAIPIDTTERNSPTRFRPAFEGIPYGLLHPAATGYPNSRPASRERAPRRRRSLLARLLGY
ncbi:hypothetical protein [Streptomyces sp. NPDC051662]|uniref:hypothetical protein n=1 Tax=Streptomyces sp. NPDC051662 TaxID=3154750 RepID=UPI0034156797